MIREKEIKVGDLVSYRVSLHCSNDSKESLGFVFGVKKGFPRYTYDSNIPSPLYSVYWFGDKSVTISSCFGIKKYGA